MVVIYRKVMRNLRKSNTKVSDSIFLMREKVTSVVRTYFYRDCAGRRC